MKASRSIAVVLVLCWVLFCSCLAFAEGRVTLSLMGLEQDGSERVWAENSFFEHMAERTGVSFEFLQYADAGAYAAAIEEAFAPGGALPDALFKANLTPEQELRYMREGQLVDLAPLLEEHAPNLSNILAARPDFLEAITLPGGEIASLPSLVGTPRQPAIWINVDWLNALDLKMPTTIDEYTEVLRAFRDLDPNQNGKRDELPLSAIGPFELKFLLHAFGLVPNDYNLYESDGTVRFAPTEAGYRAFVEWLAMALSEGLIGDEAFRSTQSARGATLSTTDADAPLTIGSMITVAPFYLVDMDSTDTYAVMPPLQSDGKQIYRRMIGSVSRGTFAITSACPDVAAALRFVDQLYTEEGGRLAFAGLEGVDYTAKPDGSWSWSDGNNYAGLTEKITNSIINGGDALTPGLEPAAFVRNSEIKADNYARVQTDTLSPYLVDPFPLCWPTDTEHEARIEALQLALGSAVDTAIAEFAMGKRPLDDAEWAAFLEALREIGADEFIALWQQKLDAERAS